MTATNLTYEVTETENSLTVDYFFDNGFSIVLTITQTGWSAQTFRYGVMLDSFTGFTHFPQGDIAEWGWYYYDLVTTYVIGIAA